ncbi:(d)CMP kinase [Saprospira sp. CCB-QB6]|uniref:(d)CMP kinase n=1 Tax=Saprospira sp. CCB-QB6 TaxID=3023936 RepID=UPI002349C9A7|nr:(d)CMP kinase [Saprospira sp. CCB-QB6]WCL81484.1 (d)CMP kinase [Saprospira sp. CCB-QB6]
MPSQKIIIALDGFAACGKSTLAKSLAKKLNYIYVDTGAMYRAVTLYFLNQEVSLDDEQAIAQALDNIRIDFRHRAGANHCFLNGEDVEEEIRKMHVSKWVSPVAAISAVRRFLVKQQQAMGRFKGLVMDGRDIGTVVFPEAELKLFMTASYEVRSQRRLAELQAKGLSASLEEVRENLMERDEIDSSREDSPLRKADDAITIDNSELSMNEQLDLALDLAYKAIEKKKCSVSATVLV